MLRSALFLLILTQFAVAQSSAPPAQGHEQHQAPAQPAQAPASPHQHHPGQGAAPAPAQPAEAPPAAPSPSKPVASTAPVITLNGYCEAPAAGAAKPATPAPQNCKKVITKAEFEKIIDAVVPKSRRTQPELNEQLKQAVARQYAELLVMSNEARKRGIQRKPTTQELMRISQIQVLAQSLLQDLNEKAAPTPAEVAQYHSQNKPAFEEAIVRRLFIPKEAPAATPPTADSKPATPAPSAPAADAAGQKAFAEKARGRAAAGEDFDKIQNDAFAFAKNTQAPPTTQLGPRRRGTLPPEHDAAVFALKPGEVSQLFDTPTGWYMYKVESKRDLPLEEVRDEITRRLQPQKFNDARTAITSGVSPEFNADYFGAAPAAPPTAAAPAAPSAQPAPRGPRSVRGPQPAQPATPAQPPQPR